MSNVSNSAEHSRNRSLLPDPASFKTTPQSGASLPTVQINNAGAFKFNGILLSYFAPPIPFTIPAHPGARDAATMPKPLRDSKAESIPSSKVSGSVRTPKRKAEHAEQNNFVVDKQARAVPGQGSMDTKREEGEVDSPTPRTLSLKDRTPALMVDSQVYEKAARILDATARGDQTSGTAVRTLEHLFQSSRAQLDTETVRVLAHEILKGDGAKLRPADQARVLQKLFDVGKSTLDYSQLSYLSTQILGTIPKVSEYYFAGQSGSATGDVSADRIEMIQNALAALIESGSASLTPEVVAGLAYSISEADQLGDAVRLDLLRKLYVAASTRSGQDLTLLFALERNRLLESEDSASFKRQALAALYGEGSLILPHAAVAQERAALLASADREDVSGALTEEHKVDLVRILHENLSDAEKIIESDALYLLPYSPTLAALQNSLGVGSLLDSE